MKPTKLQQRFNKIMSATFRNFRTLEFLEILRTLELKKFYVLTVRVASS